MSWPFDHTFVILPTFCFLKMIQITKDAQMPTRLTRNLTDHPSRLHNCCKTIHQIKHQSSSFLFSSPPPLALLLILGLFPCTPRLCLRRSEPPPLGATRSQGEGDCDDGARHGEGPSPSAALSPFRTRARQHGHAQDPLLKWCDAGVDGSRGTWQWKQSGRAQRRRH